MSDDPWLASWLRDFHQLLQQDVTSIRPELAEMEAAEYFRRRIPAPSQIQQQYEGRVLLAVEFLRRNLEELEEDELVTRDGLGLLSFSDWLISALFVIFIDRPFSEEFFAVSTDDLKRTIQALKDANGR